MARLKCGSSLVPGGPAVTNGRRARLIDEHRKRIGDPSPGGSTRQPIMTAYRQQAHACAASLTECPRRTSDFVQWSRMLPIFFCAMCMDGTPESSGAFTTSLLKAPPRSPDGHQGRSPKSRVGFSRMKSREADLWWQQASAALTWRDTPRHSWASHGADAFQVMATLFRAIEPAAPPKPKHNRVVLMVDKHGVLTRSRRNQHHRGSAS